jgi:hypothetical protein
MSTGELPPGSLDPTNHAGLTTRAPSIGLRGQSKTERRTGMDQHELNTLADLVADKVAEKQKHSCFFREEERKAMHEFASAISDEGANRETHIIVLRIGKNVQVMTQRMAQWMVGFLLLAVVVGIAVIFARNLGIIK